MNLYGTPIPCELIEKCIARMKAAPFKAKDISDIIMAAKLPKPGHYHTAAEVAMRGAGNIIQAQRKKGFLRQAKPFPTWQWVQDNT